MNGRIALEGLIFHAFHGVYAHEKKIGNRFEVDVAFEVDVDPAAASDELGDTVDYEAVYKIIQKEMEIPSHLLEHVGERIVNIIFDDFPRIRFLELKLSKLNPAVGGMCNRASIQITKKR